MHWLAVSVWGIAAAVLAVELSSLLLGRRVGLGAWASRGGARFYRRRLELVRGVSLLCDPVSADAGDHVHVVLPGAACEAVGVAALLGLLVWARERAERVRVARLDVAIDGCPFTPGDALAAVRAGQVVTRVSRGADGLVRHRWVTSNGESTLYVGSRGSERMLRIYDSRGFTRVELECTDGAADRVAWLLVGQRDAGDAVLAKTAMGVVRGHVDFGERRDGAHGVRGLRLLPWWAALVGSAERIRLATVDRREDLSVDRRLDWLHRQVWRSVAVVRSSYGSAFGSLLDGWLDCAERSLTDRERLAIAEFRAAHGLVSVM